MDKYNKFMKLALKEEKKAYNKNEIPVGAIIVFGDKVISKGHNLKENKKNVLKHAELIAIEKASKKIGDWRLNECILYTTLFPCPMCASAIQQARIKKIIYLNDNANKFTKKISSNILKNKNMNHQVEIERFYTKGTQIRTFFKKIRKKTDVSRETLSKNN